MPEHPHRGSYRPPALQRALMVLIVGAVLFSAALYLRKGKDGGGGVTNGVPATAVLRDVDRR